MSGKVCGIAMLLAMLTASPASGTQGQPMARAAIFGGGKQWVVVTLNTLHAERVTMPMASQQATVSPNARSIAFISMDAASHSTRLFVWERDNGRSPRMIGEDLGYYADPRFDQSGDWIYFVHNPVGRGRPTEHLGRAFAQLYRIRADGAGMEALSDEMGCHYAPTPLSGTILHYAHTDCHRTLRWIERLDVSTRHSEHIVSSMDLEEVTASPGGRRLAWLSRGVESEQIVTFDTTTQRQKPLFRLPRTGQRRQLTWASENRLLFVDHDAVWAWSLGTKMKIAELSEVVR